jgi:hypothetical protein
MYAAAATLLQVYPLLLHTLRDHHQQQRRGGGDGGSDGAPSSSSSTNGGGNIGGGNTTGGGGGSGGGGSGGCGGFPLMVRCMRCCSTLLRGFGPCLVEEESLEPVSGGIDPFGVVVGFFSPPCSSSDVCVSVLFFLSKGLSSYTCAQQYSPQSALIKRLPIFFFACALLSPPPITHQPPLSPSPIISCCQRCCTPWLLPPLFWDGLI